MDVLIDGRRYIDEALSSKKSIGIGVTTHNRNALAASTVAKIQAHSPGIRIVVVDDASESDVVIEGVEVYKFRMNVGIARAKNKCLELLSDCEHIFLFDDDCYPIADQWYAPYVTSAEPHLMYLFDTWASGSNIDDDVITYEDGKIVSHERARGCMIYIDRTVLQTVGGMDTRYGKAMNEHLDWTNRIYNAGLTTFRNMDVPNSNKLIYSLDEHQEVVSSIPKTQRRLLHQNNTQLLQESLTSKEYMPYGKDVVIACYFAGVPDVQRGNMPWAVDESAIEKLRRSIESRGFEFVLIHNCFLKLPNVAIISRSPYWERWLKEWQYLRDHPEIRNVFLVDATDVDMLNDPFPHLKPGMLYVGDEPTKTISCDWLTHNHPKFAEYFIANPDKTLLNCGIVGGERHTVMELIRDIYIYGFGQDREQTEMGVFNYLLYTKYADRIEYGRHITTLFKQYEPSSSAWWRHK